MNIYFVLKIKIIYSRYNNSSNYVIVFEFKYILSVELERIWGFLSGEFFTWAWQRGRSVHVYWTPCASIAYLPATEKKEKEEEDRRKKRISWPKMLISFTLTLLEPNSDGFESFYSYNKNYILFKYRNIKPL